MKHLSLLAAAAIAVPAASATAATLSFGGPGLASDCYRYAETRDSRPDAMNVCSRALAEEALDRSNRAATYVNRGVLRMMHRDVEGAELDFDAALELNPSLSDAWLNKAFLHLRTGDGQGALPLLQKAMELRARRPALAYFARGLAHEQSGDLRAAYADLKRARALEPGWDLPKEALSRYQIVSR